VLISELLSDYFKSIYSVGAYVFLGARASVLAMVILSVRLSVRPGTDWRPRETETSGLYHMIA